MLYLYLSLALAQAAPTAEDVALEHPQPYWIQQDAKDHLVVVDRNQRKLDAEAALRLAGLDQQARHYAQSRRRRGVLATGLFVAGGLSVSTGFDDANPVLIAIGGGLGAGGWGLSFGSRRRHLEYWAEASQLQSGLSEFVVASPPPSPPERETPRLLDDEPAPLIPRWELREDGTVADARGGNVNAGQIAEALGDEETASAYRTWSRQQNLTWSAFSGVGLGVAMGGVILANNADDPLLARGALSTAPVGIAMLVGGMATLVVEHRPKAIFRWFDPDELERAVSLHNDGPVSLAPEPEAPKLTLMPVLSPVYIGVRGTF